MMGWTPDHERSMKLLVRLAIVGLASAAAGVIYVAFSVVARVYDVFQRLG